MIPQRLATSTFGSTRISETHCLLSHTRLIFFFKRIFGPNIHLWQIEMKVKRRRVVLKKKTVCPLWSHWENWIGRVRLPFRSGKSYEAKAFTIGIINKYSVHFFFLCNFWIMKLVVYKKTYVLTMTRIFFR